MSARADEGRTGNVPPREVPPREAAESPRTSNEKPSCARQRATWPARSRASGAGWATYKSAAMLAFAEVCERVAATNSRTRKVALVADYLRSLGDEDLARAALFLTGSAFPRHDPRRLSAGHATLRDAAIAVTGWDLETVRLCLREVGDTAEGIALLLVGHGAGLPFTLAEAETAFEQLEIGRASCRERVL